MNGNPLAVFRADASLSLGGGHVYRCLGLANALAEVGWRCAFACGQESAAAVPALAAAPYQRLDLDCAEAGEAAALAARWPAGCDLLVVDHYGREAVFEDACRPWAAHILAIDDMSDRAHASDLLLDATPGRRAEAYDARTPAGCRLLLGPRYAMVRREFADARAQALTRRYSSNPAANLIVSFGAVDAVNMTATALEAIASTGIDAAVAVLLGAAAPHRHMVEQLADSMVQPVSIYADVPDLAVRMAAADENEILHGRGVCPTWRAHSSGQIGSRTGTFIF